VSPRKFEPLRRQRGTVVKLEGQEATLEMEDGSTRTVSVPEMLDVSVGTTVQIYDTGDAKPIMAWGQ
jgi:hypothetical protein